MQTIFNSFKGFLFGDGLIGQMKPQAMAPVATFHSGNVGLVVVITLLVFSNFCLAQGQDGTVVAWGRNDLGQADYPFSLTNAVSIGIGFQNSLAARTDGSVVGWGDIFGQGLIPSGATNVVNAKLGQSWNVALRMTGQPFPGQHDKEAIPISLQICQRLLKLPPMQNYSWHV